MKILYIVLSFLYLRILEAGTSVEGRTSALACPALAASPIPIISLYGEAQDAQHGRGHRVAHPAPVFSGAHVQAVMPAVFNAPILAGQFEPASGTGRLGTQTGDQPNGLDFLLAPLSSRMRARRATCSTCGKPICTGVTARTLRPRHSIRP